MDNNKKYVNDKEYFEFLQEFNKKSILDEYEHNLQPKELDNMISELNKKVENYEKENIIPTISNEEMYELIKKESDNIININEGEIASNPQKYLALCSNMLDLYNALKMNSKWYIEAKHKITEIGNKHKELYDWCKKVTNDENTNEKTDTSEIDKLMDKIDKQLEELNND